MAGTGTAPPRTRTQLTPRQAAALREAIALREAAAAGTPTGSPRPGTPRTAGSRTGTYGTATSRTATSRTTSGRPAAGRPAPRRKPATSAAARKRRAQAARELRKAARRTFLRRWSRRVVVLGVAALAVPAAVALLLPGGAPGGPSAGAADPTSLALAAQSTLLASAGQYHQLEQAVVQRRAELQQAQAAEQTARAQADADQALVGSSAAELYRSNAANRYPLLGLDAAHPAGTSDVLYRAALADLAADQLQGAVVRARRSAAAVDLATEHVTQAAAALATATQRAAAVLADVRGRVDTLSTEVTGALAGFGAVGALGEQQARDQSALQRWQGYLAALAGAGIDPPSARELADPADLPAGLSPALDSAGRPIPGVAWAIIGSSPVTVLPAETVAAVSSALSQLGKPYVAGASGTDTYDCGGFTAASWLLAGYSLPLSPAAQWAAGTAVPVADLQVGDLVVTDGGLDVGIYLGAGDVLGSSAAGYRVAVRSLPADAVAVRVTLGTAAQPNAALTAVAGMGACGAPLPPAGLQTPAWGGYANGRIPASALCSLGVAGHELRCDAAASYRAMSDAFAAAFGSPLCITDSYRSFAAQVTAYRSKPKLAAWPGTSNHGWALAVDLCGGINSAGSPQWLWMQANAGRFGFVNPPWAQPGAEKPEPWHWEYGNFG